MAICSFAVTVNDTTPPQFDFCPTTVSIAEFDVVNQVAVVTWQEPIASDNCTLLSVSSNFSSGDSFPLGITKVIYTATDGAGNIATCEFQFDVIGNQAPIGSPSRIEAYSGEPTEICLVVSDPDNDNLRITEVNYSILNGVIELLDKNGRLCLIYTSFNDFEGEELFYVTVCDDGVPNACTKVEVGIKVSFDLRLDIYKAFSPNNDNINDVWVIENIENYPDNHVMIYDRLGGVIYSAKGYNNVDIVWDGHSNQSGQDIMPSGTYFYKIDLGSDISTPKGYVELIR